METGGLWFWVLMSEVVRGPACGGVGGVVAALKVLVE